MPSKSIRKGKHPFLQLCEKHNLRVRISWNHIFRFDIGYSDLDNNFQYEVCRALILENILKFLAKVKKVVKKISEERYLRAKAN